MTFLDSARAATDDQFRLRVTACVYKLAGDVLNEPADAPNHAARAVLARDFRQHLIFGRVDRFAWLCATNPSIATTVSVDATGAVTVAAPDGDIEFVCAGAWDDVAADLAPAAL